MDDFSVTNLYDSRNEWAARLVNVLAPLVAEGFTSILEESYKLCVDSDEEEKYLMTFQNMISNIPSWSAATVEAEKDRILASSGCSYMNDLITCVHVIQLKILSCVRVGHKQKPIEIDIPSLEKFIHRLYTTVARRLYSCVYLFEKDIPPLQTQKHNRELETIVKECILNTVRDSIPVEEILKAYLDETTEEEITEEVREVVEEAEKDTKAHVASQATEPEVVEPKAVESTAVESTVVEPSPSPAVQATEMFSAVPEPPAAVPDAQGALRFSHTDERISTGNVRETVAAPKDVETLERISSERIEEEEDAEDTLTIHDGAEMALDILDVNDIERPVTLSDEVLVPDIEVL